MNAVHLTPREAEVVGLVSEGCSQKEIARRLGVSPDTVDNHIGTIWRKVEKCTLYPPSPGAKPMRGIISWAHRRRGAPDHEPGEPVVLFVQAMDSGMVKIVHTTDASRFLHELQCHSPARLTVLGLVSGGVDTEAKWHNRFAADRRHGRWFRCTDELLSMIELACVVVPKEQAALLGEDNKVIPFPLKSARQLAG